MNTLIRSRDFVHRAFAVSVVASLLLSLVPMQAQATPPGNNNGVGNPDKECQDNGFDFGIVKFEANETTPDDEGSAADDFDITVDWVDGANEVDWTANPAVDGVVSKEGPFSFVWSGGTSGTITPDGALSISHITFCGDEPEPGEITIEKVIENGPENVSFQNFHFTLNGGSQINFAGGEVILDEVAPGDYEIVEVEADGEGYTTSYSEGCEGTLEAGDEVTCTITNTYVCPDGYTGTPPNCVPPPPELCDDINAENYGQEAPCVCPAQWTHTPNGCEPPVPGDEDLKVCKYNEETDLPIAGWKITITDGDDLETVLYTGNDGCVTQAVNPANGPFTVEEELPEDWNQEVVQVSGFGGAVVDGDPIDYCTFDLPIIVPISEALTTVATFSVIAPENRCDFYNYPDPVVLGCTDPDANNYVPEATPGNPDAEDCNYPPRPCLDENALNYNDPLPCVYPPPDTCEDQDASNFGQEGECEYPELQCLNAENLLTNGSFEEPVVEDNGGQWQIFDTVLGWAISLSDGLELWRGLNGGASDGEQNAELDGNDATRITQPVITVPGAIYKLSFDYSPRPQVVESENEMEVWADGVNLFNVIGDGTAITTNSWTNYSDTFVATSALTDIAFEGLEDDVNESGGVGPLLDNAVLCLVELPDDNGGGGDNDDLVCELTADDTSLEEGDNVTLSWTSRGATTADLDGNSVDLNGNLLIENIQNDTIFTLTVTDDNENEEVCTVSVDTRSGGGGGGGGGSTVTRTSGGGNDEPDGDVLGESTSAEPLVLGEQVSAVPLGAADTGRGGAAAEITVLGQFLVAPRRHS